MSILVAYIPTLNQRHIDWFTKHGPNSVLYLVSKELVESLVPRLARNMASLPAHMIKESIEGIGGLVRSVYVVGTEDVKEHLSYVSGCKVYLPDEDVTQLLVEKFMQDVPKEQIVFEMIWARYDMSAVTREQPVIPDMVVSNSHFDKVCMKAAIQVLPKSPDWWRQVAALIVDSKGDSLAIAFNRHMPDEYVTYAFSDPRLYANAGEKGKSCAMHAERGVIAECARRGLATEGASVYVTTFPCEDCAREIVAAGIKKVFFKDGYSVLNATEVLREGRVSIVQVRI
ncbi:MAG: deaminase [Patescibacteria group bacterium]